VDGFGRFGHCQAVSLSRLQVEVFRSICAGVRPISNLLPIKILLKLTAFMVLVDLENNEWARKHPPIPVSSEIDALERNRGRLELQVV
jgi:hypothetical protein